MAGCWRSGRTATSTSGWATAAAPGTRATTPSGSRRNRLKYDRLGGEVGPAPSAGPLSALVALAVPGERCRVGIPAGDGVVEPGDELILGLRVVALEGAADDDPLDGLGQVQPGAADRGVQRHDAVPEQPADDRPTQMPGQVVPDQDESERRQRIAGFVAEPGGPPGERRALVLGFGDGWEGSEHGGQLLLEPGMEHGIGRVRYPLGADLAGGRSEQRQQLGGPAAHVLVGQAGRLADRRPSGPRVGDRLVGPGLVLAPERDAGRL